MKTPAKSSASSVYQLKVTLQGSKPPIWRRVLVPGAISLGGLHEILQAVMGWDGGHLHQFKALDGTDYGSADPEFGLDMADEERARLDRVLRCEKESLIYLYDFGDGWEHKVVLEKILSPADDLAAPSCIGGKRACPPDDCGGVWGYADFLAAIADPKHPDHDSMMEWIDREFDPEAFDPQSVNARLVPVSSRKSRARRYG